MSQISEILKAGLEAATGEKIQSVYYVQPHGPSFEMCGMEGGWMYTDEKGDEDTLGGYTAIQAITHIIAVAKLEAMQRMNENL